MKELNEEKIMRLVDIAGRLQLSIYAVQVAGIFPVYLIRPSVVPVDSNELIGPLTLEEARKLSPHALPLLGAVIQEFLVALPGFARHASRQQKPE